MLVSGRVSFKIGLDMRRMSSACCFLILRLGTGVFFILHLSDPSMLQPVWHKLVYRNFEPCIFNPQGTMGCTPNRVPIVFIVFSRETWG